jgi:serine/threonine-protein kinase HipA
MITLKPLPKKRKYRDYSDTGIRGLLGSLKVSPEVAFDRQTLESFPAAHSGKMSISGCQPKMSASVIDGELILVKENGTYIIKPSPAQFPHLAENEHALMVMARSCKFETPPCGLIKLKNAELAFVIKRYDRDSGIKLHQEQLDSAMGLDNKFGVVDGKRVVSYARVGKFISENLKAVIQYAEYFRRIIFSYVVGNNDHHVRNFSLLYNQSLNFDGFQAQSEH